MRFLEFPRGQRNGIIVLSVLIVILAIAPFFFSFFQKNYQAEFDTFEKQIDEISIPVAPQKQNTQTKVSYFKFNPNLISEDSLKLLGLSDKQVRNWINFRKKKGRFYQKKDLKKLYAIDDSTYDRLEKYIFIPQKKKKWKSYTKRKYTKKPKINLNTATLKELEKCYGINSKLGNRIIKYRKILGGFARMEQLKEVYGLQKKWYAKIASQLYIDKSNIRKIEINKSKSSSLSYHPYISKYEAKQIVKERVKNGKYLNAKDLQTRNKLSDKWLRKISDYLVFK